MKLVRIGRIRLPKEKIAGYIRYEKPVTGSRQTYLKIIMNDGVHHDLYMDCTWNLDDDLNWLDEILGVMERPEKWKKGEEDNE